MRTTFIGHIERQADSKNLSFFKQVFKNTQVSQKQLHIRSDNFKTKDRSLQVAQRLFASLEFAVITMREVAQRAHTNVASTHNYFGPKKAMVVETVTKIIDLINASRQQHLVEQRKFAGKDPIAVDDIFRAFVLPICNEIS